MVSNKLLLQGGVEMTSFYCVFVKDKRFLSKEELNNEQKEILMENIMRIHEKNLLSVYGFTSDKAIYFIERSKERLEVVFKKFATMSEETVQKYLVMNHDAKTVLEAAFVIQCS